MANHLPSTLSGWDFSRLSVSTEGPEPGYESLVKSLCSANDSLLDIGTGGGEKLLGFATHVMKAVGIDIDPAMVKTARENTPKAANIEIVQADSTMIPFPDYSFEIVIDRHAPFSPAEVLRVLKPGGTFITQQVSEGDKRNWKQAFGRGQEWGTKPGTLKANYLKEMRTIGFSIIEEKTVDTTEYYKTMDDVIFLLANTPIIPDFDCEKDQGMLEKIQREFGGGRGIKTNSERFLIIARKIS